MSSFFSDPRLLPLAGLGLLALASRKGSRARIAPPSRKQDESVMFEALTLHGPLSEEVHLNTISVHQSSYPGMDSVRIAYGPHWVSDSALVSGALKPLGIQGRHKVSVGDSFFIQATRSLDLAACAGVLAREGIVDSQICHSHLFLGAINIAGRYEPIPEDLTPLLDFALQHRLNKPIVLLRSQLNLHLAEQHPQLDIRIIDNIRDLTTLPIPKGSQARLPPPKPACQSLPTKDLRQFNIHPSFRPTQLTYDIGRLIAHRSDPDAIYNVALTDIDPSGQHPVWTVERYPIVALTAIDPPTPKPRRPAKGKSSAPPPPKARISFKNSSGDPIVLEGDPVPFELPAQDPKPLAHPTPFCEAVLKVVELAEAAAANARTT